MVLVGVPCARLGVALLVGGARSADRRASRRISGEDSFSGAASVGDCRRACAAAGTTGRDCSARQRVSRDRRAAVSLVVTSIKRRKPGRKTPMTAAERKEVSERMKRYWAGRRAAKDQEVAPVPAVTLVVNGAAHQVDVAADTPLLYVLRNELELSGPQFGCGLSQCGACSVLVDGKEARSCVLAVTAVAGKQSPRSKDCPPLGEPARAAGCGGRSRRCIPSSRRGSTSRCRMCGFCQNGMMIKATELLDSTPSPTRGPDQDRVHERPVAAPLPLRHLFGDPRRRAARVAARSRRRGRAMAQDHAERPRRDAHPTAVRQDWRRARRRLRPGRPKAALGRRSGGGGRGQEFARRGAPDVVVRDPRGQHHPDADRQGGFRTVHRAHRVQADRRRGTERPVRGDHRRS